MEVARTKQHIIEDLGLKIVANKIFFTTDSIHRAFGITEQTLANWKKRAKTPLEHSHYSTTRLHLYEFFSTISWYFENIDENKAIRSAKNKIKRLDFPVFFQQGEKADTAGEEDITTLPALEIDRLIKIQKLQQEQIETKALRGEYIPIEDFAKGQAEPIMILLADLRRLISMWSLDLVGLNQQELQEKMDEDVYHTIEYIRKFLTNKQVEADDKSFYDAIDTVKALLDSGMTVKEITELAEK